MTNIHVVDMENPPVPAPERETKVDAVVIGGGPNGLICAAYLAKAGMKVALLERRQECGGGLATEEILFPGTYANTHATYHMMVDYLPIMKDFDLKRHSLLFIKPNKQTGIVFKDGSSLLLCSNMLDSVDEIAKFSYKDAKAFEKMIRLYTKMVEEILAPGTYYPPIPPVEFAVKLGKTKVGKALLDISESSPLEIIDGAFTDTRVKAALLYISCMWGLSPEGTGLGFMVPLLIQRNLNKCLCVGGSHKLASSLGKEIILAGGMIHENSEVTKIIMEGGRAIGAETYDGRRFLADIVVSSLDPHSNFKRLVGEDKLPKELAAYVDRWQWDKWSLFTLHVALKEPPAYRAADRNIGEAFMNILGIETMEDVLEMTKSAMGGDITKLAGHATTETIYDKTLARGNDGRHSAFLQTIAPYDIHDGWEKRQKEIELSLLELWQDYARNMNDENIVMRTSESPLDIERRIPCMARGSIKHGDYSPLQMGYFRPNDLCSSSKTPIEGLYLCGASSYPGGLIIGGPGYIAANTVAEDAGVKKWWKMPDNIKKYVEVYLK
ncbi:MAG: NAD(P)/FAD-dependent oxidoreductase [bacterium]